MVDGWGFDGIDGGGEEKGREKRKRTDEVVGERRFGFWFSLAALRVTQSHSWRTGATVLLLLVATTT